MEWGPTTTGAMLTGAGTWRLSVSGDTFAFRAERGKGADGHLSALRSVRVRPGVVWAGCELVLADGTTRTVDGIPNADAAQMVSTIEASTREAISRALTPAYLAKLRAWVADLHMRVKTSPDDWADRAQLDKLLAGKGPPKPRGVDLDMLLGHRDTPTCLGLSQDEFLDLQSPRERLTRAMNEHDAAVLEARQTAWIRATIKFNDAKARKWWSASDTQRVVQACPPPMHPTLRWEDFSASAESLDKALSGMREGWNAALGRHEPVALGAFFGSVERQPLTAEQIDAVICFDDHQLIVAAAGSGKTSTMIAKAGYALKRGICRPEQILLLAFNGDAAAELSARVAERLAGVTGAEDVVAKTFHAFGKHVITQATGKKPTLAPWLERGGDDTRQVVDIVEGLSKSDKRFASDWAEFKLVYARDIGRWDAPEEHEDWDSERKSGGFRTVQGEVVKSKEERTIANWLFYHGVNYRYETPYRVQTATTQHRQYLPDFHFPDIDVYYEHFALDKNGNAPSHFDARYVRDVEWKRSLHAEHGTTLIETTSHELREGKAFTKLGKELRRLGIKPKFDPSRQSSFDQQPLQDRSLAASFRTFQQHAKSNRLSAADLEAALRRYPVGGFKARLKLYLKLYSAIASEWESRLRQGRYIDYDDMLNSAADLLEAGRFDSPFLVILADEFQDSSNARARLLRGIARSAKAPYHLCVVGDDWQAINRFAGADIAIMTGFEQWFAAAERRMLTTTFRCPQDVCEASSEFVSANPRQIRKEVKTTNPRRDAAIELFSAESKESIPGLVYEKIKLLAARAMGARESTRPTVMLLNRYRHRDVPANFTLWKHEFAHALDLSLSTVHASKGLEADYVLILNLFEGTLGFPCKIEDDPVLELAMPSPDTHPFAEERRLFYVAMTRAKREVWLFTTQRNPSQFVVELVKNGRVRLGEASSFPSEPCDQCGKGMMVMRSGSYGAFHACSRFPACTNSRSVRRQEVAAQPARKCHVCGQGTMKPKWGRRGMFLSCSRFPQCRGSANIT